MRKRIVPLEQPAEPEGAWLDLGSLAEVEISSEDSAYPIESALVSADGSGWRASAPGRQQIRLLFAQPQRLTRIRLCFEETSVARSQEYVLRWAPGREQSLREIVRQQWNFSPDGATEETEDHHVDLPAVAILELVIDPDAERNEAFATLKSMRVG